MIAVILTNEYGVGIVAASATTVAWAARQIAETHGIEAAKKELRKANNIRNKHGATWCYEEYCGW